MQQKGGVKITKGSLEDLKAVMDLFDKFDQAKNFTIPVAGDRPFKTPTVRPSRGPRHCPTTLRRVERPSRPPLAASACQPAADFRAVTSPRGRARPHRVPQLTSRSPPQRAPCASLVLEESRRPPCRMHDRRLGRQVQRREDRDDHLSLRDRGDDPAPPAAAAAQRIHREDALQKFRPRVTTARAS